MAEQALAVLAEIYAALAANDADAYTQHYTEQATVITPGRYHAGRQALRADLAGWFAGPLRGARGVYDVQSTRLVNADTAIVISKGSVLLAGQSQPSAEDSYLDTWVLARHDGRWQVEAFHSCPEKTA
jgi:uncharacterized protein (TIGR02246 family)